MSMGKKNREWRVALTVMASVLLGTVACNDAADVSQVTDSGEPGNAASGAETGDSEQVEGSNYRWHTYFMRGWSVLDTLPIETVALDEEGNIYVAGGTCEAAFTSGGESIPPLNPRGQGSFFVAKFNGEGQYLWHTCYGGLETAYNRIASRIVFEDGAVYVTGASGESWNGPNGEAPILPHAEPGTMDDLFLLKLNTDGAYQWHTFSSLPDSRGEVISVDGAGNLIVCGQSSGGENVNGLASLNAHRGKLDEVVIKFDNDGNVLWYTFQGGVNNEECSAMAVDSAGNIFTISTDQSENETQGQWLIKLNTNGAYQWDAAVTSWVMDIQVDGNDNLLLTGTSSCDSSTGNAPVDVCLENENGTYLFVEKRNTDGNSLWYNALGQPVSTTVNTKGDAIAIDAAGNIFIAGRTIGGWVGPEAQAPVVPYRKNEDVMVVGLDSEGHYLWHGFYGDRGSDVATAIAVDNQRQQLIISGFSASVWNSPGGDAPVNGSYDVGVSGGHGLILALDAFPNASVSPKQ